MNIGIITLPLYTNYGGILQAYALQTVLKKMGHTPITMTQAAELPANKLLLPLKWIKRGLYKYLKGDRTPVFLEQVFCRTYPTVSQYTQPFIDRHITTLQIRSAKELRQQDYDAFIVGSDQIWRPMYYPQIETAYLAFTKGWPVKRISYAASFGTDVWEYSSSQTRKCRSLVQDFDAVSVREATGITLCKNHLGREAVSVLDPTMLLSAQDYIPLFESCSTPQSPGNLLVYILDHTADKRKVIETCSKEYKPFYVNSKVDDLSAPLEERIQPPVEQWLRGFHDAEFIITDSFHACVFAILFNKPFLVYGNKGRGMTRFHSLLSLFGLEERLIESSAKTKDLLSRPIDWLNVNQRLERLREESYDFLKQHLTSE